MKGPSLVIELGGPADEDYDEEMVESLGEALAEVFSLLKAGKKKEAAKAFCMAMEIKGN